MQFNTILVIEIQDGHQNGGPFSCKWLYTSNEQPQHDFTWFLDSK